MNETNYMCILRSGEQGCEKPSPSDMEAMQAKYMRWQKQFANNIVSMGGALSSTGAVVSDDSVKDGPYAELKEVIGGYMMIKASSLNDAIKVIQASPMVANPSVSIEIREISTP